MKKFIKLKIFFKNYNRVLLLILVFILFLFSIYFYQIFIGENKLIVRFLNIGQGDSILIQTPNSENILIDAGPNDKVINKLEKYLNVFDKNIDLAIFTHTDSDHITGFYYILQKYNAKRIIQNGDENKESEVYKEIGDKIEKEIEKIGAKKIIANCGDKIIFENKNNKENILTFYIIHPIKNELIINESNDNSIIVLLVYGDYSFLFTGDASKDIEKKLFFDIERCFNENDIKIIENNLKNLTVLKVAHHGSNTGNSEEFLKKIKPKYSIISAGEDNKYGHPTKETIEILEKYSKNVLNTIENGDIKIEIKEKDFILKVDKLK